MAQSKKATGLKAFIITRLVLLIPFLFFVLSVIFIILRIIPGDPVRALFGQHVTEEGLQKLRHEVGLDKPLLNQYFDLITRVIRGDFGVSIRTRRPVLEMILACLPATVELTIPTIILSTIGIYIGSYCATKKDTVIDVINKILTTGLYSIPVFWLGILFQLIFGVSLGWLPIGGRIDPRIPLTKVTGFVTLDCIITGNMVGFVSAIEHLILPVVTTTIWISCMLNRMTRSEMVITLKKDFIVAAKSRGIPKSIVIYKHALKNVLLPIITIMGFTFAWLLGGYVVVETTFSINGIGRLLVSAIYSRDYPLIEGCVFFYTILVGIISLVVDITYAFIDPRVKF